MLARFVSFWTVAFLPFSLCAQDSSSRGAVTPFRRGQWAAQFQVGSSTSLGFVKFRSPTRALVVDLRLSGGHGETNVSDSSGTRFAGVHSDAITQLRFGSRRYRAGTTKLVSHYTFGLLAGFDHSVTTSSGQKSQSNGWTAGLFGDVGGTYLVTSQLGLGALATASLSYSNSVATSEPGNHRSRSWQIGGSAIAATLVATLFF
jgi:hypothetical protein